MGTDLVERTPEVERAPEVLEQPIEVPVRRRHPHLTAPAEQPATGWPARATAIVVVLVVATVLLGIAAVVGLATRDGSGDAELEQTIATLTAERDDLVGRVETSAQTIATLATARDQLGREVDAVNTELDAALAQRDQLLVGIDAQTGTIDDLDATIDGLMTERDRLLAEAGEFAAVVEFQTTRAEDAIVERDALLDLFPIAVETELAPEAALGRYDVVVEQVYCTGLGTCGTMPPIDELAIRQTADDRLELAIEGYPTPGLAELDGVLHAVMDATVSDAGIDRIARTTVTIYAQDVTIEDDGTRRITDLGATMTMYTPATSTSTAGTAVYALELTAQS